MSNGLTVQYNGATIMQLVHGCTGVHVLSNNGLNVQCFGAKMQLVAHSAMYNWPEIPRGESLGS